MSERRHLRKGDIRVLEAEIDFVLDHEAGTAVGNYEFVTKEDGEIVTVLILRGNWVEYLLDKIVARMPDALPEHWGGQ